MARIRSIKPEFWTNEKIVDCSTSARLLFIGLWTFSDDAGVHPASARRIKMQVFPGDDITSEQVDQYIEELIRGKLLREFSENGEKYWHIVGFNEHQKIDRPTYKYPKPPGWIAPQQKKSPNDRKQVVEESSSDRRVLVERLPPDGIGEETKGKEGSLSGLVEVFGEIHLPESLNAEELNEIARWARSMSDEPTFFPGSPQLAEKILQASRYKNQGHSIAELVSAAIAGGYKQLYPGRKASAGSDSSDPEDHPAWKAILKVSRDHGTDLTDDREWRANNLTKRQKEAKRKLFEWEELPRMHALDIKRIAKQYVERYEEIGDG